MINVGISGIFGRVGRQISAQLENDNNFKVTAGLSRAESIFNNINTSPDIDLFLQKSDCIIDFSSPELLEKICDANKIYKKTIISGTTGLSDLQIGKLKENSQFCKVFWSMNTSFGIAIIAKISEQIAKLIPEAEIEIHEEHHNQKKDAPSGTAILLGKKIAEAKNISAENFAIDRNHKRNKNEIGFSSLRAGSIVGKHDISFYFDNQLIKISHEAFDRKIFASGAIEIAKIIMSKPEKSGFFEISDIYKTN